MGVCGGLSGLWWGGTEQYVFGCNTPSKTSLKVQQGARLSSDACTRTSQGMVTNIGQFGDRYFGTEDISGMRCRWFPEGNESMDSPQK